MKKKNLFWTLAIGGSILLIGVYLFSAIRSISQISLEPPSEMQSSLQELRQEGQVFWEENQKAYQHYQEIKELEKAYNQALKEDDQEKIQELEKEIDHILQDFPDTEIDKE